MNKSEIKKIVEALLFASPEPLTQSKVNGIFTPDSPNLKKIIEQLNIQYDNEGHAFEIRRFWRISTCFQVMFMNLISNVK